MIYQQSLARRRVRRGTANVNVAKTNVARLAKGITTAYRAPAAVTAHAPALLGCIAASVFGAIGAECSGSGAKQTVQTVQQL